MTLFAGHAPNPERAAPVPDLVVRDAAEGDLPALERIAAEREGSDPDRLRAGFEKLLREHVPAGEGQLLVAAVGDESVGFGKVVRFRHGSDVASDAAKEHAASPETELAPEGWYLAGVVVAPGWRRRGVGDRLTAARLEWISRRATRAYYLVNARNTASIDLHRRFGFIEITRRFSFPGVSFVGGEGILFGVDLKRSQSADPAWSEARKRLPR